MIPSSVQQLPRSLPLVRTSAGIVAPSTHWKRVSLPDRRRCLIMLISIPRCLSQTSCLLRNRQRREHLPSSCKRPRTKLLSRGDRFRTQQDRTNLCKAHHALEKCPCVPDQRRTLHTRLQGNFSQLVVSHASSKPALRQWRTKMFGCAAMIT